MRNKLFRNSGCSLMVNGRLALWILLLFLCAQGVETLLDRSMVFAADIEVLTPASGGTVLARNPETHLVLRQSGNGQASKVKVEKTGAIITPLIDEEGETARYLHFRLPLNSGQNIFTILPSGQRLEFTYKPLKALLPLNTKGFYFFHKDDQLPESCGDCHDLRETETIEPVFLKAQTSCGVCHKNVIEKNKWQHSTTINLQCLSCHQQYIKPWRIGFREGRIDDTCVVCHTSKKDLSSSKYLHGAMIGGCTLCHNPHNGKYRYLLWAEGSAEICVACHEDKKDLLDKNKSVRYVHGIIFGKGCTACHDPHASENSFMLLKPINELCVSCHQELAGVSKGHPVERHPVAGPPEKRRRDRKLSCASCHDPHGSPYKYMLIGDMSGGSLCRVCHKR